MQDKRDQARMHDARLALGALKRDLASLRSEARGSLGSRHRAAVERMGEGMEILEELLREPNGDASAVPVDLSLIVDQIHSALRSQFEARGIGFRRGALPSVIGREADLRRLFLNLMANSLHHMGNAPEREIEVMAREDGDRAVIKVRDTGPGLPPEVQSSHHGFREVASVPARGLDIVAEIVRAHDGSLTLESGPGPGATINVRLPRAYFRVRPGVTGL